MNGIPLRLRSAIIPLATALAALTVAGCVFNNKLQPLAGEDAKSVALSYERQSWLEKTGASRAFEDLRKALRTRDHATVLALLGLDHERLTFRYAGRDFRLTDVYGTVAKEIMA